MEEIEPLLAKHLEAFDLAAWIAGFDEVAQKSPEWVLDVLSFTRPPEPPGPPRLFIPGMGEPDEPIVRFPPIEKAAESLQRRRILTREQFDQVADRGVREARRWREPASGREVDLSRLRG